MICPHCRKDSIPTKNQTCPHCGSQFERPSTPSPQDPEILDAELLDEHPNQSHKQASGNQYVRPEYRQHYGQEYEGQAHGFTRVFYTSFPGNGQNDTISRSCMATLIMLVLAIAAAFQYGLLAGIGFLVFAGIGRAVSFFVLLRRLLEGRHINPWFLHAGTWLVCWLLVAWLSGGMDS